MSGIIKPPLIIAVAAILVILGLLPKIGVLISVMPNAVLRGLFGMVATSGMKIVTRGGLTDHKIYILTVALSVGLGVTFRPDIVAQLPDILSTVLSSGITVGAIIAILLNLLLPKKESELSVKIYNSY